MAESSSSQACKPANLPKRTVCAALKRKDAKQPVGGFLALESAWNEKSGAIKNGPEYPESGLKVVIKV
jgi:hypothetical protein